MPASAIAGARRPEDTPGRLRSLSFMLNLLAVLFLLLPVLLFVTFNQLDRDRRALALATIRDSGLLIGAALQPQLATLQPAQFGKLQSDLAGFAGLHRRVTLLYKPNRAAGLAVGGEAGFFYVAGIPAVVPGALAAERQRLADMGVLSRLGQACSGNTPLAERVPLPGEKAELLTSVSPSPGPNGCWAVVVSTDSADELTLADQRADWARPEIQAALALYAAMALICLWIFSRARATLLAFRRAALSATEAGPSFVAQTAIPELVPLAREFDQMVARLGQAAATLRQAAEENAHALKGRLATIRQLVAALPESETVAIVAALDRLDGLVRSARQLDTATAETLERKRREFDLSALVEAFCRGYRMTLGDATGRLGCEVAPGVRVHGDEEMVEVVLENLVENAFGFTPERGRVTISLGREGAACELRVADEGSGVDPDLLPHIFDRYVSTRSLESVPHYGIGLWLVRQNVTAMGGTVAARNRAGGGLEVVVKLPVS